MRLRPYKPSDAQTILSWVRDEETFRRWVTDRYPGFCQAGHQRDEELTFVVQCVNILFFKIYTDSCDF